jgi:hypothetical protein
VQKATISVLQKNLPIRSAAAYYIYHIQRCCGEWQRQERGLTLKVMNLLDLSKFKGNWV